MNNTKEIYIVKVMGGRYEDSWELDLKAFTSEDKAVAYLDSLVEEDNRWLNKAKRIHEEFRDENDRSCWLGFEICEKEDLHYTINSLELIED